MKSRILKIAFYVASVLLLCPTVRAQQYPEKNWSAEKIKGTRYIPYSTYRGLPFLNDGWVIGKVVFADGEISDTLNIRYSSYADELVYYNSTNSTQIVIDKASLNGFSFVEKNGYERVFKKLYFDGFWKGVHYFEILSDGETELLGYRKVELLNARVYKDESGKMKSMEYTPAYVYYFYSPEKGFSPVRMNLVSFLSKFDKTQQKPIKRMLRKKRIRIEGEVSFIQAWNAIKGEGYQIAF
jgi:hypothetical protein